MATVTFNYNARSVQANNLLNYILSTGIFTPVADEKSSLEKAFEDIENGRVYHAIKRKRK